MSFKPLVLDFPVLSDREGFPGFPGFPVFKVGLLEPRGGRVIPPAGAGGGLGASSS